MNYERALIEPEDFFPKADFPARCILTFFRRELKKLCDEGALAVLKKNYFIFSNEPVYIMKDTGEEIAVVSMPIGAPAAAAVLEGMIYGGSSKIMGCGYAGVLDPEIAKGTLIVADSSFADEGLSPHYFNNIDMVRQPHPAALKAMLDHCVDNNITHRAGGVWTTDAIFRETAQDVADMRRRGMIAVDMETSALYAVAAFRERMMGMYLYALDNVGQSVWDSRKGEKSLLKERDVFNAAVAVCRKL